MQLGDLGRQYSRRGAITWRRSASAPSARKTSTSAHRQVRGHASRWPCRPVLARRRRQHPGRFPCSRRSWLAALHRGGLAVAQSAKPGRLVWVTEWHRRSWDLLRYRHRLAGLKRVAGRRRLCRKPIGIPSIASASVIQFDQAAGFVVTNPSGSIAQIGLGVVPSPSGHRAIDGGGGDSDTPRGILSNKGYNPRRGEREHKCRTGPGCRWDGPDCRFDANAGCEFAAAAVVSPDAVTTYSLHRTSRARWIRSQPGGERSIAADRYLSNLQERRRRRL